MIQKYDDGWSVFGIKVSKAFVIGLGALLVAALLVVGSLEVGVRLGTMTVPPVLTPPPAPPMAAYADGVSATLDRATIQTSPSVIPDRPLYVVAYPFNGSGCASNCYPEPPLASGYTPQCSDPGKQPCFLLSPDPRYAYHDLIVDDQGAIKAAGALGQLGSWYLVTVEYNQTWTLSKTFRPFTSAEDLRAALGDPRQAAQDFTPLQPLGGGATQYQLVTNIAITGQLAATPTNTAPPPTPTPAPTRVGK